MPAYILWMGNQIAGSEISQNRKKHKKSRVLVPEDAGMWLAAIEERHEKVVRIQSTRQTHGCC